MFISCLLQPQNQEQESFVAIATAVNDIFHEDVDAYWVAIRIYGYLHKVKELTANMVSEGSLWTEITTKFRLWD